MPRLVMYALTLVVLLGPSVPAHAQGIPPNVPIGVVLEGYLGQGPAGVVPTVRWTVMIQRQTYTFTATKLEVRTGNTSYMNIITGLDGYPVNLTFFGEQLDTIAQAGPDTKLSILGTIQVGGGARYLFVSSVTATAPAPTAGAEPAP